MPTPGENRDRRSRPSTPPPDHQHNASPGEDDELNRILQRIAEISDLKFDEKIDLGHDTHVEKRQMEEILDAGLGKPWMIREICSDEPWVAELEKERKESRVERPAQKSHSGMDLLGKYVRFEKKIVIFDTVCKMVSSGMNLNMEDLASVVLAHEAAHAVTHLGRDHRGGIWRDFGHADVNDKEQFAQMYDLLYLINAGNSSLENVFRQLSDRQSPMYNLWTSLERKPVWMINHALLDARLKSMPPRSKFISPVSGGGMVRNRPNITVGSEYDKSEIELLFGIRFGYQINGIVVRRIDRRSDKRLILLFQRSGGPYPDQMTKNKIRYVGAGLRGNQSLSGANKVLAERGPIDGVHFFHRSAGSLKWMYLGHKTAHYAGVQRFGGRKLLMYDVT